MAQEPEEQDDIRAILEEVYGSGTATQDPDAEDDVRAVMAEVYGVQAAPEKAEGTKAGKVVRQVAGGAMEGVGMASGALGELSERLGDFLGMPQESTFFKPAGETLRSAAPPAEPGLLAEVSRGVGSSLSFLAGGVGGAAGIAMTGILVNGFMEGEQAKARSLAAGKSDDEAERASWEAATRLWTVAGGASEAIPLGRILFGVDRRTGGLLKRAVGNLIREGVEEFGQEAGQEFVSVLNENLDSGERQTLRELVAEHKGRLARAGLVGALAVGPISLVATAVQRPMEGTGEGKGGARDPGQKPKGGGSLFEQAEAQGPPLEGSFTGGEPPLATKRPGTEAEGFTTPPPIVGVEAAPSVPGAAMQQAESVSGAAPGQRSAAPILPAAPAGVTPQGQEAPAGPVAAPLPQAEASAVATEPEVAAPSLVEQAEAQPEAIVPSAVPAAKPKPTDTPEFKRWFGASKVVDEKGAPLVVYHGTRQEFAQADPEQSFGGLGAFFASESPSVASGFAGGDGGSVMQAFFKAERPFDARNQTDRNAVVAEMDKENPAGVLTASGLRAKADTLVPRGLSSFDEHPAVFRAIRKAGFDSVILEERGARTWAVFDPSQVKSATGNRGTFDPEDPMLVHAGPSLSGLGAIAKRFLGMPTETDTGSLVPPVQTAAQRRRQEVQTAMEPFERAAASSGRPEFQQVAERATTYQDRAADRWKRIHAEGVKPLLENAKAVGLTDADQYLYARHAPDANAVTATRTEGAKTAGSGMSTETAKRIVQIAESGPNAEAFKALGKQWDALMKQNLDMAVEYQLITPETRDNLQKLYPHYAPLKTLMDEGERRALGIGKGADIRGPEFKMRLGRKTEADAPIAHGLAALQRTLLRGEKRNMMQPMVDLLTEQGGEIPGFVKMRKSNLIEDLPPNVVGLGPDIRLEFEPEYQDFVDAIQNPTGRAVDQRTLFGKTTSLVGKLTRMESGLATRYNPVFPIINAVFRDPGTAFIISTEHGLAFASRVVKDGPKAWLAMFGKGPWAKHADAYRAAGGQMGTLGIDDVQGHLESIKAELETPSTMKRGFRSLVRALSTYADAGENAMRLSAFVHAQTDLGMTLEQATAYAKNLTTNFRRKGLSGNYINSWWMFSNAGIQGTERAMRALGNKNVQKLVGSAVLMSMMLDWINRLASDEDEDGERFYDAIPEYVKRNNIILPFPGGRSFLTIPAPFVFNWFHALGTNIGEEAWDNWTDEDISGSFVGDMATAAMDSFNPLGGTDQPLTLLLPTIFDPVAELATNKDFAGRQIARKPFPGQVIPPSEQYWPDVNPTVRAITDKLNEWTGGDKYEAGDVSINPEWIEHLGKFLTSGTGQFLGQMYDIPDKAIRGEEVTTAQIPLIRRLVKDPSPFAVGGRYRDARDEVRLATKRTEGEPGPPTPEDKPFYMLRQQLTNTERLISAKEEKLAAAKTPKLKAKLEAEIREIQAKFTRRVNEAKKTMASSVEKE